MQTDTLSAALSALADPTRRGILAQLAGGDATVTELAAPYTMSVAAVSKHIKVLEGAGLVSRGKDAQKRPCHLEAAPLRAVSAWLVDYERFWVRSVGRLEEHLKTMQRRTRAPKRKS
jgi:DNA-binding transcriptional ArsR family regulator